MAPDNNQGPWGQKPNNQNNNPWGSPKGSNRNNGQPDFDEFIKKMNQFFDGLTGKNKKKGGGASGNGRIFSILGMIIAVVWLASGFYMVQPGEHGVILRFGEWQRTQTQPGLGYHFPWPIETVNLLDVAFQRRIEIGFNGNLRGGRDGAYVSVSDVPAESLMLTGDENIIDIDFVVVWNIKDARKFLFNIRDPENTIKKVAESAMREVIGQTKIQMALTEERNLIQQRTRERMQEMLDDYQSGVLIAAVQSQKVDPPAPVVDAFNDVQRARADKERLRNEAEAYRNDVIPRARGEAEKLSQEAQAYREKVVSQATGDASRFLSVYQAYSQAKDVTSKRLYLETLEDVFQNAEKVIVDKQAGGSGIVPYLPLNELKNKKAGE